MKKEHIWRALFYALGIVFLCFGVTLNTKTGLGLSPITSVPYSISTAFAIPFSTVLFWYYIACVLLQAAVKRRGECGWKELAQVPLSFVFSVVQEWMGDVIAFRCDTLWQGLAVLPFAALFTGFGIALMVRMELVPNPADGVPFVLSRVIKKEMGLTKNIVDGSCVLLALVVDLLFTGGIVSIGLGTLWAMVCNGRAIALFDRLFTKKITALAGLSK